MAKIKNHLGAEKSPKLKHNALVNDPHCPLPQDRSPHLISHNVSANEESILIHQGTIPEKNGAADLSEWVYLAENGNH